MIKIKRVYEEEESGDGYRVLVDRLWPRGIKKENLHYQEWPKEICPSTGIRKSFGHDPSNFAEFKKDYLNELKDPIAKEKIKKLAKISKKKNVTLLYAAHDPKINHAVILKNAIEKEMTLD